MRKRSNIRAKHNIDFKNSGYFIEIIDNKVDSICLMLSKNVVSYVKYGNKILFKHKQTMDRAIFYINKQNLNDIIIG